MCGIAGIMYKGQAADAEVGKALIAMLDGCQHRGPDSTGFALQNFGDYTGEAFVFSTSYDESLSAFVGLWHNGRVNIFRTLLPDSGQKRTSRTVHLFRLDGSVLLTGIWALIRERKRKNPSVGGAAWLEEEALNVRLF